MSVRTKVLIIDDDVDAIADLSRYLLRSIAPRFMVVSASSVSSALSTARDFRPDCLVIDASIGDLSGSAFLTEYRQRGGATPAVMLVAHEDAAEDAAQGEGVRAVLVRSRLDGGELARAVAAASETPFLQRSAEESRAREADATARLEAAYQRASFLMHAGKRFAETLDEDAITELVHALAFPFLGDVCIVDLIEASVLYRRSVALDEGRYPALAERHLAGIAPSIDAPEGVPAVMRSSRPAFYDDTTLLIVARDDADIADLRRDGLRSLAVVPMVAGGRCIGTLTLGSAETDFFRDDRRALAEEFAQRAAVAIANARVVESARISRDQAESSRRRLSFLSRISSLFSRSLDSEATFRRLTKLCTTSLCDTAEIFLVDADRGTLVHRGVSSGTPETERLVRRLRLRHPPTTLDHDGVGRAAATGRSEFSPNDGSAVVSRDDGAADEASLLREWGVSSAISVPFATRGQVVGVLTMTRDRSARAFTAADVALAEDVARRCATFFENARIYEREHSIASALQHSLLPAELPEIAGTRLASRYVAGADGMDVGGDWYDVVPLGDGRVAVTIGDVVGRGMLAAATMGQLRDVLRAYAFEDFSPARALSRLNALLFRVSGELFATAIALIYDSDREQLTIARAGHPPPLIVTPDRRTIVPDGGGLPIGASPVAEYVETTVSFPKGSTLVLYTDGLVESRERSADEGIAALSTLLERAETDPEVLVDRLLEDLAPNAADDTAILVLRALAPGEQRRRTWIRASVDEREASRLRREATAHVREYAPSGASVHDAALVLGELLGNVARHAPGPVRLSVELRGDDVVVELADRGPGIDEAPEGDAGPADAAFATSGRGLFIARAVSTEFRTTGRRGGGTLIHAAIPLHLAAAG